MVLRAYDRTLSLGLLILIPGIILFGWLSFLDGGRWFGIPLLAFFLLMLVVLVRPYLRFGVPCLQLLQEPCIGENVEAFVVFKPSKALKESALASATIHLSCFETRATGCNPQSASSVSQWPVWAAEPTEVQFEWDEENQLHYLPYTLAFPAGLPPTREKIWQRRGWYWVLAVKIKFGMLPNAFYFKLPVEVRPE